MCIGVFPLTLIMWCILHVRAETMQCVRMYLCRFIMMIVIINRPVHMWHHQSPIMITE